MIGYSAAISLADSSPYNHRPRGTLGMGREEEDGRADDNVPPLYDGVRLNPDDPCLGMDPAEKLESATIRLADALSFRGLSWTVPKKWYNDPDINQVIVNFG